MKRTYLLAALCLLGSSAFAAPTGKVINEFYNSGVSPDGRFTISSVNEATIILDLVNETNWTYTSGTTGHYYTAGHGNCFTNNGRIVGSDEQDKAYFWENGTWTILPGADKNGQTFANAITPDGLRICGEMTGSLQADNEGTMLIPCIWNSTGNNTYSEPIVLPHPTTDFSDRAPQYITALWISDDGKTIVGQVRDYSGTMNYPILYTEGANGEWSYTLPGYDLINPDKVVLPEYPGEAPEAPEVTDYMTDAQKAAYEQAMTDWRNNGYNPDEYPEAGNYMDADKAAEYNAAVTEYNEKATAFNEALQKYFEVFYSIIDKSPQWEFNAMVMSPNGCHISTAAIVSDPEDMWAPSYYSLYTFNLTTGAMEIYPKELNLLPSQMFNNGALLASTPDAVMPGQSFFKENETAEFEHIYDYYLRTQPETAKWLEENMAHTVVDENGAEVKGYICSGFVRANADMTTIVGSCTNTWTYDPYFISYSLTGLLTGVDTIAPEVAGKVTAHRGGIINVTESVDNVAIYDFSGRKVFEVANPAGTIDTGLNAGMYILRATMADGNKTAQKVVF